MRTVTHKEWLAEAARLFGDNPANWRFVCPSCGHVASAKDWRDAGGEKEIAVSCVGRFTGATKTMCEKPGPCNYAGYGLFHLNPVHIEMDDGGKPYEAFEFAAPSTPSGVGNIK